MTTDTISILLTALLVAEFIVIFLAVIKTAKDIDKKGDKK